MCYACEITAADTLVDYYFSMAYCTVLETLLHTVGVVGIVTSLHTYHYLMQGQIALRHLTAQYLSLVRGDVVSEKGGIKLLERKLRISLSLSGT